MDLQHIVSERRRFLKISQLDLSEMSGVGLATIKSIELGRANPTIAIVEKLFVVLGLELSAQVRQTF